MITISQAEEKSDDKLISFLKEQWDIGEGEPIYIKGELKVNINNDTNYHHYRIYKVEIINRNIPLKYPLSNLSDSDNIPSNGIYAPPGFNSKIKESLKENKHVLVRCKLVLSSVDERKKQKNPLLLNAEPVTLIELDKIFESEIIKDKSGNILIESTAINSFKSKNKKIINEDRKTQEQDYEEKIRIFKIDHKSKVESLDKIILDLDKSIGKKEKNYNDIIKKIEIKNKNIKNLESEHLEIYLTVDSLHSEKLTLDNYIETKKEDHMKRMDKFRSFLKNKADSLLSLEFIDQSQYDQVLDLYHDNNQKQGNYIDFKIDLNANFSQAVSHIQAYLFAKDIIYPKYILEDYFSLIQTNDLIILAGDSGSGKTNLVKSFADAVGGVSKIIPVKPSWTSSEDLLGYYNPLQKTYLSTPFLDALIEASQNPEIPYFICLDEMNLARVEYYFADFLSVLEERNDLPEIFLYSDDESNHVLSEFNNVIRAIEALQEKYKKNDVSNFYDILKNADINNELKVILGLSDKVSLISYHSTLRRMLGGILSTPSSITFPSNVRIIGAINIDETTHYLSPKVLDRAHVIKFDNPLLADWNAIEEEVNSSAIDNPDYRLRVAIGYFGERKPYPRFSLEDEFCQHVVNLTKNFFKPLGVEIGLRTIRQGLNYNDSFSQFNDSKDIAFNNFILHKILPKFTFDGNSKVGDQDKSELVDDFKRELKNIITTEIDAGAGRSSIEELTDILKKAKENDGILNYWA